VKRNYIKLLGVFSLLFCLTQAWGQNNDEKPKLTKEVSGKFAIDYRYFPDEALYAGQHDEYISSLFQPEIYLEWKDGTRLIQFTGMIRIDQYDTKRTHADIRELYWQAIFKKWELSIGAKKVFWGVTESNHLVDIINQVDVLEGADVENKLGQPMVHMSFMPNWGTIDFYAMTYFRELQFPGTSGRLRPPFYIDEDATTFESDQDEYNIDLALRWSHSFSVFDVGLSHFYGTSRLPQFLTEDGQTFVNHYELINQSGLDVQASTGSMLWKGELIHIESERQSSTAYTVGGEYTFGNLFRSGIDLGLITEYNFDERGLETINGLDNDMFYGMRLAFNDRQSTDILGGIIYDNDLYTTRYFVEVNRRLGNDWKLSAELTIFDNVSEKDAFSYLLRNDSYVQGTLVKFF
jgi:hypothetical protein